VAGKYASAITKYLGLGCNLWQCPADYFLSTNPSFVIEPIEKVKTKSASFRKKRCGSLDGNCCFDYNWMGSRAQRVEYIVKGEKRVYYDQFLQILSQNLNVKF
jgi:hypothetical protein